MKKIVPILTVCALLSGCTSFSSYNKHGGNAPSAVQKPTINYRIAGRCSCGAYPFNAPDKWDKYLGGLPADNYFTVVPKHTDYTLLLTASPKNCTMSALSGLVSFFTAGIVPVRVSKGTIVITPTLTDNNKNVQIDMPAKEIRINTWSSWLLLPFGKDAGILATDRLGEEIFEDAAALAYDKHSDLYTKGRCLNAECSVNMLLAAEKVSSADIAFAAANAKTLGDFNAIRAKGKTGDECQVAINLIGNSNRIISKEKQMYWQLLDFYKASCYDYRRNLQGPIGITKEKLTETHGTPTSAYRVNADTESLTYKKSLLNGEQVETSKEIFTVDRGIVTLEKDE